MRVFGDHDVIAALRAEEGTSLKPVERFYIQMKPKVFSYVANNGGSSADGQDILQDGMIIMNRNIRSGKYKAESSLSSYLLSICKWRWLGELRRRGRQHLMKDELPQPAPESSGARRGDVYVAVRELFNRIDPGCKQALTAAFFDQKRMVEIAEDQGLLNEQIARSRRFMCLKKMKAMIEVEPQLKRELDHIWEELQ
jgi:RNA polymerase sigma factor (sigma-70 family)